MPKKSNKCTAIKLNPLERWLKVGELQEAARQMPQGHDRERMIQMARVLKADNYGMDTQGRNAARKVQNEKQQRKGNPTRV